MAELPLERIRTDYLAWSLATATLLFLFVGFIKGVIASPVDLTICTGLAVVLTLVPFRDRLSVFDRSSAIALLALIFWFALRLIPDLDPWGIRKLAEIVTFGIVALAAGIIIAADKQVHRATVTLLAYAGLPASAIVITGSVLDNPYTFSWVGSGGYQLTGTFLALAAVSAAVRRNTMLLAISALGCAVTGHISGAIFGTAAVAFVWLIDREWRAAVDSTVTTAGLVAIYAILVAPPLVFMRLLWKFGGVLLVWTGQSVRPEEAAARLGTSQIGAGLLSVLKSMPEDSQGYLVDYTAADRFDYFGAAWSVFLQHPLLGAGYGTVDYLGSPYPHNAILELAAETGIVGVVLVSTLFLVVSLRAWRSRDTFVVGCCTVLFLSAMVSGYFGARLLMFGFGLTMGVPLARKHQQSFPR